MAVYILWEHTVTPQQAIPNQCDDTIHQSGTTKGKSEIRIYTFLCNRVFVLLNPQKATLDIRT